VVAIALRAWRAALRLHKSNSSDTTTLRHQGPWCLRLPCRNLCPPDTNTGAHIVNGCSSNNSNNANTTRSKTNILALVRVHLCTTGAGVTSA
jgi:hypothetical protein